MNAVAITRIALSLGRGSAGQQATPALAITWSCSTINGRATAGLDWTGQKRCAAGMPLFGARMKDGREEAGQLGSIPLLHESSGCVIGGGVTCEAVEITPAAQTSTHCAIGALRCVYIYIHVCMVGEIIDMLVIYSLRALITAVFPSFGV